MNPELLLEEGFVVERPQHRECDSHHHFAIADDGTAYVRPCRSCRG